MGYKMMIVVGRGPDLRCMQNLKWAYTETRKEILPYLKEYFEGAATMHFKISQISKSPRSHIGLQVEIGLIFTFASAAFNGIWVFERLKTSKSLLFGDNSKVTLVGIISLSFTWPFHRVH